MFKYFKIKIQYIWTIMILINGVSTQDETSTAIDKFYEGCYKVKNCIGKDTANSETNCIEKKTCQFATSFQRVQDDKPYYEVLVMFKEDKAEYLGVGLGKGNKMINLAILECVKSKNGNEKAVGFTSSVGKEQLMPERAEATPKIEVKNTVIQEQKVICTFRVPPVFQFPEGERMNLEKESYYLQLAWGKVKREDLLVQHKSSATLVSEKQIKLSEVSGAIEETDPYPPYRLHGVLMTTVYVGCMPVGTIIARFYKETWTKKKIRKKNLWFIIHVILMCLSLFLSVVGYLVIALKTYKWWPDKTATKAQNHALLGTISMVLLLLQTVWPWFIPTSNPKVKQACFFCHAIMGILCYVLGIVNILVSDSWVSWMAPCESFFVTAIWIAVHATVYILLTALLYIKDFELQEASKDHCRALTTYPLKVQTMEDAPGARLRQIFLCVFIVVTLIICAAMFFLIYNEESCEQAKKE